MKEIEDKSQTTGALIKRKPGERNGYLFQNGNMG